MKPTKEQLKKLVIIQTEPAWEVMSEMLEMYIENRCGSHGSIRRKTEFDTIWEAAYNEGGIEHLRSFFNFLHNTAKNSGL